MRDDNSPTHEILPEIPADVLMERSSSASMRSKMLIVAGGVITGYALIKGLPSSADIHTADSGSSAEHLNNPPVDHAFGWWTAFRLAMRGGRSAARPLNRAIQRDRENREGYFGGARVRARQRRRESGVTPGQVVSGISGAIDFRRGGNSRERYGASSRTQGNRLQLDDAIELDKYSTFSAINKDDTILWALMLGGNIDEVRDNLITLDSRRFDESDPEELNFTVAEIARLRRHVDDRVILIAATRAQAATGTGFENVGQMLHRINIAAEGDDGLAKNLLGQMMELAMKSRRPDLGGASYGVMDDVRRRLSEAERNGGVVRGYAHPYTLTTATFEVMRSVIDSLQPTAAETGREISSRFIAQAHRDRIDEIMASLNHGIPIVIDDPSAPRMATERDAKQALAAAHCLHDYLSAASPQNARTFANWLMSQMVPARLLTPPVRTMLTPMRFFGGTRVAQGPEPRAISTYKDLMDGLEGRDQDYADLRRSFRII